MDALELQGKRQVRIDFAPMVDLGFLLITFFVFTTKMQDNYAMKFNMPADGIETNTPLSTTITLTLKGNGSVEYLEGNTDHVLATGITDLYKQNGLRNLLIDKRKRILEQHHSDEQYTVLIQPTNHTQYKEVVDVLDEMLINNIKKYVLLEAKE
ncbi:MAG: biopolymer transporter ExbD [Chitinophagaceae bacterium]